MTGAIVTAVVLRAPTAAGFVWAVRRIRRSRAISPEAARLRRSLAETPFSPGTPGGTR